MSTANLQRSSVFGVTYEDTAGTLKALSSGNDLIPLRQGFAMTAAVEELASDELLNDIAAAKSYSGIETPSGTHSVYFKNSQTSGTLPEYAPFLVSAFGTTVTRPATDTVTNRTTSAIQVADGTQYEVGEAVLLQDATGGYVVRNISAIATNTLTLNYATTYATNGVTIAKNCMVKPMAVDHPSFSAWLYTSNGAAIQAMAGCKTSSVAVDLTTGQMATCEFGYEGSAYYFNPMIVTSANKYLNFKDDYGTKTATLTEKIYQSPIALASEIQTKIDAASTVSTLTCSYSSTDGKYTLSSDGTTFELLWVTGDNSNASIGSTIGFSVSADDTAAVSYTSDSGINLACPYTATYDNADNIVVKNAEIMIGDSTENFCRKASAITLNVGTPLTNVTSICSTSGVLEKLTLSREVTLTATILLTKYESALYDKFLNNTGTQAMVNIGSKDNSGNWVAGKGINIYLANCSITSMPVTGDDIVSFEINLKGYVTGTANTANKDCYINFF